MDGDLLGNVRAAGGKGDELELRNETLLGRSMLLGFWGPALPSDTSELVIVVLNRAEGSG
jgi:hypothetical protein